MARSSCSSCLLPCLSCPYCPKIHFGDRSPSLAPSRGRSGARWCERRGAFPGPGHSAGRGVLEDYGRRATRGEQVGRIAREQRQEERETERGGFVWWIRAAWWSGSLWLRAHNSSLRHGGGGGAPSSSSRRFLLALPTSRRLARSLARASTRRRGNPPPRTAAFAPSLVLQSDRRALLLTAVARRSLFLRPATIQLLFSGRPSSVLVARPTRRKKRFLIPVRVTHTRRAPDSRECLATESTRLLSGGLEESVIFLFSLPKVSSVKFCRLAQTLNPFASEAVISVGLV